MRIPRKSGEAVIVLGGKSGAFLFGYWATVGAVCGGLFVFGLFRIALHVARWLGFYS